MLQCWSSGALPTSTLHLLPVSRLQHVVQVVLENQGVIEDLQASAALCIGNML